MVATTAKTNGSTKVSLAQKKDAAAQKLAQLARTMKEEQDEQKRAWMSLRANFVLIYPYPPCIQPLNELEEITISQLLQDTHHRGKFVWLMKFSELVCFRPTNTITVVHDKNMDSKFVEIMLADQKLRAHGLFPPGTVMALKEPFVTKGDFSEDVIRVDHLSDIITVPLTDERVPQRFNSLSDYDSKATATQWKEQGNEALKKNDFPAALNAYTMALNKVSEEEKKLRQDLHRNRAQVQLMLGRHYAAQQDAERSVCGTTDLDVKAKYRKATSLYERAEYKNAQELLEESDLSADRDSQTLLQRVNARRLEEETGEFEWEKILSKQTKQRPRVDAGSYLKKVEAKTEGALAGRGLFAREDIAAGDIVVCSKPLCSLFLSEPNARFAYKHDLRTGNEMIDNFGLWRKLVNMLSHDLDLLREVGQLQAKHISLGNQCLEVDGKPVVDVFQIHDILFENKMRIADGGKISSTTEFGIGVVKEEDWEISSALWGMGSYINHSCLANVHKVFIGDLMLLRAVRPIKAGEEITLSYISPLEEKRKDYLKGVWGIDCQCGLCIAEKSDGLKTTQTRQKNSVEFVGRNLMPDLTNAKRPNDQVMKKAKGLMEKVEASYDMEAYKDVPRAATLAIATWVIQAHYVRKEHDELFKAAHDFFRAMGYTDASFDGAKIVLEASSNAILPKHGIDVLQMLASVRLQKGEKEKAVELEGMAKRFYVTMNGLGCGYKTINPGLI